MYKLLIVDDESEIRNGLCNYYPWGEVGFECLGYVEDGAQAIEYLGSHQVDVILSDIVMPNLTGIDLARYLHEYRPDCKLVFLSGYQDFDFARKALEYGVRYYILKPTRYEELTQVFTKLRQELDGRQEPQPPAAEEKQGASSHRQVVQAMREYVEGNYPTATLGEVAKRVFMHPFYLSKLFKEETGQNFSDYLIEVRMKRAAELLADPAMKTYEISERIGYSSAKNFTRTFKAYYGVTPREFRTARGWDKPL